MPKISRFIIAGMLGLFTLPALAAGRGSAAPTPPPAKAASGPPAVSHVATQSAKPPKTPSVGGAAPAPVAAPAPIAVRSRGGGGGATVGYAAAAVPDDDPVEDNDPVQDSIPVSNYISPPTVFPPAFPLFDVNEGYRSRVGRSVAVREGTDTSATTAAATTTTPTSGEALWKRIDTASAYTQTELSGQPEYQAAETRLASAQSKVAALRAGGQKDSDQIQLADQKALEAREEIARMRMSMLETDPNFRAALTRNEPRAAAGE
jgi:hypothetical protein